MFKEYKLPKESFIGGWFISSKICDGLVSYFNEFSKHAVPGKSGKGKVTKSVKDSLDLVITENNLDKEILPYRIELQKILQLYLKRYPEVDQYSKFNVKYFNIQKYNKKGGFKKWHFEKGSLAHTGRVLVFMTYLNDIDNGGTMFKYQKIATPSIKGLTLIWPTDFTHTHKGQIVDKEKIITTGWFELI
jgi:hypothetical protein|tara:strand:- start:260 stop:826 length:567 start_codon:yes stop_codon:yes gene_type:complete